jgi:hypothetical protein
MRTDRFVQEPVWSADGTDLIATHIVIEVSGILNACFLKNNINPAAWIEVARPILLQRGHQLYFYIGGTQIIPPPDPYPNNLSVTAPSGNELVSSPAYTNPVNPAYASTEGEGSGTSLVWTLDAKLGPKPISLNITQIRGGTYAIHYAIETWVPYCAAGGTIGMILSNRWESSLDIDSKYYYTRTTTGTLVMNGQWLATNSAPTILNTSSANSLIFPPLFKSWKREVVRCVLSSDQLTLHYSIQDRQQYTSIPQPAVTIDATYAEICPAPQYSQAATAPAQQNLMQQNVDITISGDPNTQIANSYPTGNPVNPDQLKYYLMQIMFNMVFSRIQFPLIKPGTPFVDTYQSIIHFELREDMMNPIVGCRVVAVKVRSGTANPSGSPATWAAGAFASTMVAKPINITDMVNQIATQPISLGNWATFLLMLNVAPQDPCAGGNIPTISGEYSPYSTAVYTSQTSTAQTNIGTAYTQTVNLSFSAANHNYPFTDYTATVDYPTDNHIIQCPVMYDVGSGFGSGTTQASSVFCQTASATSKKIIHWKASRLGTWPKIPRPDSVDSYGGSFPADQMLNYTVGVGEVELSNDGITRHYSVAGCYEIGMARRLQWDVASTVLSTVCNAVIGSSIYGDADASFPTNNFVSGILEGGPSPGAS